MRKSTKLMAGLGVVAGLGVALAPIATFADGTLGVDTLRVTVTASCTLDNETTQAPYQAFANLYTGSLGANAETTLGGSGANVKNTVKIICNKASGYSISGSGEALARGTLDETTGEFTPYTGTDADSIPARANPAAGTAAWGVALRGTSPLTVANAFANDAYGALSGTVATSDTVSATGGDTFTIVGYKVSTKDNQKDGTYQGTATYTLSQAQ